MSSQLLEGATDTQTTFRWRGRQANFACGPLSVQHTPLTFLNFSLEA